MNTSAKGYVAGGDEYLYPGKGDPLPPAGAKVIVLTSGGIASIGPWKTDGFCIGWAPLPKRNHTREVGLKFRGIKEGT